MAGSKEYDYIIVGAGSAGCMLAYRLGADPNNNILILEAGGPDTDPLIHIPLGLGKMHDKRAHDWGYDAEPEQRLNGREIEAMRGKVVGGSSSINVMAYVRGNRGDYDRWADNGANGWSYADVLPYFRRMESWEGGEDTWRGGDGPLNTQFAKSQDPLWDAWIEAGKATGIGYTEDYNGEKQEGLGRSQSNIYRGRRHSAATAFLRPAMRRGNVDLRINTLVSKIVMEGKRAAGVEYFRLGRPETIMASREVILSGGVFNSPQLLMLSGIGPAGHLRSFGIEPVIDSPYVGKNLQDHLAVQPTASRPDPGPFRAEMRFDRMVTSIVRAHLFGKGPATVLPGGLHGFLKLRSSSSATDIQFLFRGAPGNAQMWFPGIKRPYLDGFGLRPVLLHPESRGEVLLRSANPFDKVRIIQNFLEIPRDLETLREGVKIARDLLNQPALDAFRGEETAPGNGIKNDDQLDDWIRRTAITAHHPSCTTPMGDNSEAVLDTECRVKGADNLRVVDASAMPDLVSGNIHAAVLMIAEKVSDNILGKSYLAPAKGG
ncbi:MAG: Oxygen-dependent choline dehydrogenase [Alphaproteobacteria bacterium MarineAlpha11_Bin1]|nr:MAG: Oxygen-dependent choline dehydrogenase [Alphaproteobacteria bacterium MarineAlpha11_Bin1]